MEFIALGLIQVSDVFAMMKLGSKEEYNPPFE
jgi:hypothetical protein